MEVLLYVLGSVIGIVLLFLLWASLHELSHAFFVNLWTPVERFKFTLYPHFKDGKFYWARVQWKFKEEATFSITKDRLALIYFAPRWLNFLACFMICLTGLFTGVWKFVWAIIWLGGIIDLANGSFGFRAHSDLIRYSKFWEINPWFFRIIGFVLCLVCLIVCSLVLL